MDFDRKVRSRRETFLSSLLVLLALSGVLFMFFIICGGLSMYILAVVAGIGGLCFLNYLLWGHAMSERVTGEREEADARAALEEIDEQPDDLDWPGRSD